jgi:glucose/mannose transport system permease protein
MKKDKDKIIAVLMVMPSILAVGIFIYGFIGWSVRVSFTNWRGLLPSYEFVGFKNYIDLLTRDPRFKIDIRNTVLFTVLFVVVALVLGLLLAILLDRGIKGEAIFRNIYLFPMAISFIVAGISWRWLMNPAMGERMSGLNLLFDKMGLDFLINQWYTTPNWGIAFIAIPAVWQMSGYVMALYLSGLRSIPTQLREAAMVDGATEFEIYRYVIMPLMRPVTLSAMIILGHISLKVFDLIIATVGKQIALDVPAIYMWQTTFDGYFFSRGAAIGILLLLSVTVLVIPYLRYSLKSEADV